MRTILNRINDFARDRRGNFGIMFALLGTTLLMGTALAVDVARMFSYHSKLTFAVDAAALATTQGLTLGDIALEDAEEAVRKYLDANLDGRNLTPDTVEIDDIEVDPVNRTVQIDAHTIMPMTMAGIVGYDNHRVAATSKAKFSDSEVEVVMALDITGSMSWDISGTNTKRITALKNAAKDAIEILFSDDGTADNIRVGLVPYSASVNVKPIIDEIETTPYYEEECVKIGRGRRARWVCDWVPKTSNCVYERSGTEKYTDAFANSLAKIPMSSYTCPKATIVPVTDDDDLLKDEIDDLSTGGNTAGHIAVNWTYYMLSSKWNDAWPDGSDVQDFDHPGVRKYAIIMTDGEFNTYESEGQNGSGSTNSRNHAKTICTNMKTAGIKVYSIAFGAGSTAEALMKDCANKDTATSKYYYNTSNEAELKDAFRQIAADIKGLRLIN
ncbi:vWA domain-containing protein [Oricola thermophila]|uniref:Pilus assembly protein n=1 Tax=Oricola thermophila TaxID=2742145 RepID=A0A6N1VL10_9HYPH|nr:pilus assembly protein [Oricola thermophila]QKV20092.1 pilus assembly protein [Oricola thermophila]